jgi:hypothetical protein
LCYSFHEVIEYIEHSYQNNQMLVCFAKAQLLAFFGQDRYWSKLLWHCVDNNSYKGCSLPDRQEFVDEDCTQGDYLNCDEENTPPPQEAEWGQESWQEYPKPVTDESEWSDGWK